MLPEIIVTDENRHKITHIRLSETRYEHKSLRDAYIFDYENANTLYAITPNSDCTGAFDIKTKNGSTRYYFTRSGEDFRYYTLDYDFKELKI